MVRPTTDPLAGEYISTSHYVYLYRDGSLPEDGGVLEWEVSFPPEIVRLIPGVSGKMYGGKCRIRLRRQALTVLGDLAQTHPQTIPYVLAMARTLSQS